MNARLSRFLTGSTALLMLLGSGPFGVSDAMARDKYKREYQRHDGRDYDHRNLNREINRNERERRAFVAGAVSQNRRDNDRDYYRRDGYNDRYRERYDDDHDDDSKVGAVLVGAAIGAVATGVIMSNKNSTSTSGSNQ